jgi:Tfp pilus assembly protein PilV
MHRSAGFSLVEALMACALLGVVLVPVLGAFRAQLAAAGRMESRLRVDQALATRLNQAELDLRAGLADPVPPGFQPDGLHIAAPPPEATPCGTSLLWRLTVEVTDPRASLTRRATRLLIQASPAPEARP